jgi:hypothetical protein
MLSMLPTIAAAQDSSVNKPKRFLIAAGAFILEFDTKTRLGTVTTISLEDDLGMESDQTEFFLSGRYRLARKHTIGALYLSMQRDGDVTLSRDIEIGDEVFPIGAWVESDFEYKMIDLSYRYAFLFRPKYDFALNFGISYVSYDIGAVAEPIGPVPVRIEEREDEGYPVPTLGGGMRYRFNRQWSFRTGGAYFEYSADKWDASLLVLDAGVEYFPWEHVGFGLGYSRVDIDYDEVGRDSFGVFYEYDGILFRGLLRF